MLSGLEESELESMALHETQDSKVFQKFKKCIANEPQQVSYKVTAWRANAGHGFCVWCGSTAVWFVFLRFCGIAK